MLNLNYTNDKDLNDSQKQLKYNVNSIIKEIESGKYDFDKEYSDFDEPCASDYMKDILDINYITYQDKTYKGARILVAFGGPNIWIDTLNEEVQGYWGGDQYIVRYHKDALGIDDYCEEYYNCLQEVKMDLIGKRFLYVGSELMPNIPFNIIADGELPDRVKVSTWEGRDHNNKLMNRTVGDHYIKSIMEMINSKELIEK